MTDYFALLDEPRQPWLDPEPLKARFLSRSADVHPDRVHGRPVAERDAATQRYAELNAAYHCLREPRHRLLHLLELERGAKPVEVQRIPPGTMELFGEIGQTCREVDALLADRAKTNSPLVKLHYFQRGQEWVERLNGLQQLVNARQDALFQELQRLNPEFETAPAPGHSHRLAELPLDRLEQIYRALSFVSRWTAQIQERLVQLAS